MSDIPGWFRPTDVSLFNWFLLAQHDLGDLAEIGPYLGRSAVVIGSHVRRGETFTVIDLFGDPAPDQSNQKETALEYPGLARAQFEANYRGVHGSLPVIVQAPSSELPAHAAHGTHRFVHVDGSHRYEHVAEDIRSAHVLLADDGVVALDDLTSPHTPGVWAAAWEAVITGELVPIAVSENKMYGTWGNYKPWQQQLKDDPPAGVAWEEQEVLGRPLLRVWDASPAPRPSFLQRAVNKIESRRSA